MSRSKLNSMPYAQAYVCTYDDGTVILVSYATPVCEIDPKGWFHCYGLYSTTTRHHISAFMNEYTPYNYYIAKRCYHDHTQININTGEVRKEY